MKSRVLIVDDEPDVATYLAMALGANGYTAAVANSVRAGMDEVAECRPDLICLDIMMPKESGLSMFGSLRQDASTRDIPVIVISGAIGEGQFDISEFLEDETVVPPERFLEKPVEVESFLETVGELLANRVAGDQKGKS